MAERHRLIAIAAACACVLSGPFQATSGAAAPPPGVATATMPVVATRGTSCPPAGVATGIVLCHSFRSMPQFVSGFVRDRFLRRYAWAVADLDGDGRLDGLVYAVATSGGGEADLCGSGGCDLYVLSPAGAGYRIVGDVSVAKLPIRVLPETTHGWHDLGVEVAGGGIVDGYEARLRFDGTSFPSNPTVPPAARTDGRGGVVAISAMPPPIRSKDDGPSKSSGDRQSRLSEWAARTLTTPVRRTA